MSLPSEFLAEEEGGWGAFGWIWGERGVMFVMEK